MQKLRLLIITLLMAILWAGPVLAQSGYDLYQKALVKERAEGNLREAIALYQQVVREHGANRSLAARAQLRLGVLYDRLGRRAEAQRAYQAVVAQYSDQVEIARQAQAKVVSDGRGGGKDKPAGGKAADSVIVQQLWSGDDVDSMGSPSPDGRHLTFVDWSTGDLAVRDLTTGKNRRITNKGTWTDSNEYAEFSRVSPNGRQIAYAWFNEKFYELRMIAPDGANPRILYSNPELRYIQPSAWFPDGKHLLAVIARKDLTNQIVIVSTADGSVRALKSTDWRYPQRLNLSPDGRWIAYDFSPAEASSKNDIYLLAADGSREIRLVEHPSHDYVLGWSPDGERMIFASDRTGTVSVWSLRVSGGKPSGAPELIRQETGQIYPLGMNGDGSLYYAAGGAKDVYVGEFDAARGRILMPKNAAHRYLGANYMSDWSPDGERLAYLSRRTLSQTGIGSRTIVIQSVKSGEERELVPKLALPTNHRGGPAWSPDGRFLAVVGRDDKGRLGIYRVDAETGEVKPLVQSLPGLQSPEWTADGKGIIYRRIDDSGPRLMNKIVVRDLETSEDRVLHASPHIHFWAVSNDGRQVAFSTPSQEQRESAAGNQQKIFMANVLMVTPTAGGQPREILRVQDDDEFIAIAWSPDDRHLLFLSEKDGVSKQPKPAMRVPVAGGVAEPTQLQLSPKQWTGLRFHPDTKRVTFTDFSKANAEVLVMKNFLPKRNATR
jgi:Tol biopolymer transport system component